MPSAQSKNEFQVSWYLDPMADLYYIYHVFLPYPCKVASGTVGCVFSDFPRLKFDAKKMKSKIWIAAWKTPGFADRKHTKSTNIDENFKVVFGVSTRDFFHGLSWVNHGSITGSSRVRRNPGFYIKHGVSCSKPRVSLVKSWVVTGKSRVKHGFRCFKISNPVFSGKKMC